MEKQLVIDPENLGTFLKRTRIELGLELEQIAEETKISLKNLKAIETSDFASLPAEAFARGFYILYAKVLDLDTEEILSRYSSERGIDPRKRKPSPAPVASQSRDVGTMAEKPSILPFSYVGLALLILLALGALVCWYFSWNPATYLSEQLRAFESTPANEYGSEPSGISTDPAGNQDTHRSISSRTAELFSVSLPATAAVVPPAIFSPPPPPPPPRYTVSAFFNDKTKVKLTIDDQEQLVLHFGPGETATWQGEEKMRIIAIGEHKPQLLLNASPINLPQTSSKTISVTIPDSLLK